MEPASSARQVRVPTVELRTRRGSGAPGGRNAARGRRDAGEVAGTAAPARGWDERLPRVSSKDVAACVPPLWRGVAACSLKQSDFFARS